MIYFIPIQVSWVQSFPALSAEVSRVHVLLAPQCRSYAQDSQVVLASFTTKQLSYKLMGLHLNGCVQI